MVCIDDVPEVLERDTVIFSVECHTRMGEEVLLVGSTPELGCWDLAGAVRMTTNSEDFPTWTSSPIPRLAIGRTEANPVGYKYVLSRGAEGATWEQGPDRSIGLDELLGLSEEGVHDDLFRRDPSVAKSPHSRRAKKMFSHPSKSRSKSRAKSRSRAKATDDSEELAESEELREQPEQHRARAAEDSTALAEVQVLRQQLEQQRAKAAEDSAALAEVKVLKQQLEQQRAKAAEDSAALAELQVLRQQLEQQRAKAAEDSAALAELQVLRLQLEQQRAKAAEDSAALAELQVLRQQLEQQRAKAAEDSAALAELQVLRQQLEQQRAKAAEDSAARPGFYRWFRKRLSSRPGVANCQAKMNCEDELPKTNSAPVARRRRIAEDDFPKPAQAQEHDHHQQARSPKDEFGARRRIARRRRVAKTNSRRRIRCPKTDNSAKTICEDELLPKTNWAPDGELPGEDELRRRSAEDKLGA
ncbi:unnamed protein product [Polarella glacialis]|uniref:CBM20 domain-containing protein n=1 Tax=Polarella glacialis TaxID=89957 RepID=A0A813LFF1_POLGL|nr:unnamed protein product [Polarella glacialis]